jgi:alkaline phosphatase D
MRTAAFLTLVISFTLLPQERLVQSGPMVGYSEMREVALWIQTTRAVNASFRYWATSDPTRVYTTAPARTIKRDAFAATIVADSVQPGERYEYEVVIDGETVAFEYPLEFQTPPLWRWRGDPPEFTVATGSGAFINEAKYDRAGEPYGGEYRIFRAVAARNPDLMIWLGDNVYFREADWNTRTGMLHRYTHGRSIAEMQALLASTHHYAIWDDHDFGPNNGDRSFWNKREALDVFKTFWANPSYGVGETEGAITTFSWGDVDFFLLDNRYHRSPQHRRHVERTVLGEEQFQWLIDALVFSDATFKVVAMGGQFLNPLPIFENYAIYPEERARLLSELEKERVEGVVFLTGDRHHTEITRLDRGESYPLHDVTISPFTSGHRDTITEPNYLRIEETLVAKRNFGLLAFKGGEDDRRLVVSCYDSANERLWEYEIPAADLRYPSRER